MCENNHAKESFNELDLFIDSIPNKESALIAVLHKAQEIFGYLPSEVQIHVSRRLNTTAAKVYGVVTFYSYFTEVQRGEHVINVCMGTACYVRGSEPILDEFISILGIKPGQTTQDRKFSLDSLRCVGACGLAPVVMVDGKVYGRVKKEDIGKILESYQAAKEGDKDGAN